MTTLIEQIKSTCRQALLSCYPDHFDAQSVDSVLDVTESTKPEFGHYQFNSAMRLAKPLKQAPRDIANTLADTLKQETCYGTIEVAGPGFINLTLSADYLTDALRLQNEDAHLGVTQPTQPRTVLIDFSSPNIAKAMHVGHLRSTIIGDTIARVFELCGEDVLRINHVGDWGTAFGMLIVYLREQHPGVISDDSNTSLDDLMHWYRASKQCFDEDPAFKQRAQEQVVALQSGDETALQAWQIICDISRRAFQHIYDLLGTKLTERGESFYNPFLAETVQDLENKGLVTDSDGAKCIFMDGYKNRDGDPLPLMIQKSDGGYNYASTDMAAVKYRVEEDKADEIIIVTDAGQALHFDMIFNAAKRANYLTDNVKATHVGFGLVLGQDGKKFKTRSGDTVALQLLIDEAIDRSRKIFAERNPAWSPTDVEDAAKTLGIGAIKYADLSCNRQQNYQFSFDRMLQFEGNTAAFILYAYVRTQSILRKSSETPAPLQLAHPAEIGLALHLLRFAETIHLVKQDLLPNHLTDYLYTLAQKFNVFFRDCRVEGDAHAAARLSLCQLTARVLSTGLQLLGIHTLDKM